MGATPESMYLLLSAVLFALGAIGVVTRRGAITILMCIELMLNGANLALISLGRSLPANTPSAGMDGQILAFFVLAIAAAEAAVGLAIVIALFRLKGTADIDAARLLRW
jgi:NADH-quinone oxidoreductase subunit K